jgi:integrase
MDRTGHPRLEVPMPKRPRSNIAGVTVVDAHARHRRRHGDDPKHPLPARRWLVRVRDPLTNRECARGFPDAERAAAIEWGTVERAKLVAQVKRLEQADLAAVSKVYVDGLTAAGMSPSHTAAVAQVVRLVTDAGIRDLTSPLFLPRVERWLAEVPKVSPATKRKYYRLLRAVVRDAVRRQLIDRNPLEAWRAPKVPTKLMPTFTIPELRRLLAEEHRGDPYFIRFALLAYTGMRAGESTHVQWPSIRWPSTDGEPGSISIRLDPSYRIKRSRERSVPLLSELADILRPIAKPSGYVVENPRDRSTRGMRYLREFREYALRCGVDPGDRTPYALRRAWISLQLATGVPSLLVRAWAGHECVSTTQRYCVDVETLHRSVVGWPRGEFRLRTPVPASPPLMLQQPAVTDAAQAG